MLSVSRAARLAYDAVPHDLIPYDELWKGFVSLTKDKTVVTRCWNIACHLATKAALELALDPEAERAFGELEPGPLGDDPRSAVDAAGEDIQDTIGGE